MTRETFKSLLPRVLRSTLAAAVAFSMLVVPGVAGAAVTYPSFTIAGTGWGHGIGLSQYGAKGFAEHGKTGEWIATYYYPGSAAITAAERPIFVNLDPAVSPNANAEGFSKPVWTLRPGWAGAGLLINKVAVADDPAGYRFVASGGTITVQNTAGVPIASIPASATMEVFPASTPAGKAPLVQVIEGTGNYGKTYIRYRGRMVLSAKNGQIKLLNRTTMSDYLYGVVPRESSASWPTEALKAQALVARSYAQQSRTELYCSTFSQAYCGHSRTTDRATITDYEAPQTNVAVDGTAGRFVGYNGQVITTYFFSSSGGHTANVEDVWGGAPSPYYRGVPDPYCASPNDPWPTPVVKNGLEIASAMAGLTGKAGAGSSIYVKSLGLDRAFPSNFVRNVDIVWSDNTTSRVTGDTFRRGLGLKSTKFYLGGMYDRIAYSNRYSTAVKISQTAYPGSGDASSVVLVNGADDKFADALTASALGGVAHGPVLMLTAKTIPAEVYAEIGRLGAKKAYVVGGPMSVSEAVVNQVRGLVPDTERLAGDARYGTNRYGTAASVAMKMKALGADSSKVLVASGEKWTDAAVAAAVAAGSGRPIVLTGGTKLPGGSALLLTSLGATETSFFGGPATISAPVTAQICALTHEAAPARRFGLVGNRYDVAVGAAQWCTTELGFNIDTVYISSGEKFPDTVTGGVLAGINKHPLVLTSAAAPANSTAAYLSANKAAIGGVVVFGGPASVSEKTASTLASYAY